MKRTLPALLFATALTVTGCLQKDTTSTMYLRADGSFDWVVLDASVRSDEKDPARRSEEERGYITAVHNGEDDVTRGFRSLGGTNLGTTVLRDRVPYSVLRSATFDRIDRIFERELKACNIPYRSEFKTDGAVTTWTLTVKILPEPDAPPNCEGDGVDALFTDAGDHLRIVLESGSFLAVTGFTRIGDDAVELPDVSSETIEKNNGVLVFSLSWKQA